MTKSPAEQRPDRWKIVVLFVYAFCMTSGYVSCRTVGDGLFLHRLGAERLPAMYLAAAAAVGLGTFLYGVVASRRSLEYVVAAVHVVFAVLTWWLEHLARSHPNWAVPIAAVYLLAELRGALGSIHFATLLHEVFPEGLPPQVPALTGSGSTLAGMILGTTVGLTAHRVGPPRLLEITATIDLVIAALLIAVATRLIRQRPPSEANGSPSPAAERHAEASLEVPVSGSLEWSQTYRRQAPDAKPAAPRQTRATGRRTPGSGSQSASDCGAQAAAHRRRLRDPGPRAEQTRRGVPTAALWIATIVVVRSFLVLLVDFYWKAISDLVLDTTPTEEATLTAYFGWFYGGLFALTGAMQLAVSGTLIRRLGVRTALACFPAMTLVAVLAAALLPPQWALWGAIAIKGMDVLRRSVSDHAIQLAYRAVPATERRWTIAAIGGWVKPAAEAAAAVVLIEHALFGHSIRWLQTLMLICCTLWILLTWPRGIRAALRPGIRRPLP